MVKTKKAKNNAKVKKTTMDELYEKNIEDMNAEYDEILEKVADLIKIGKQISTNVRKIRKRTIKKMNSLHKANLKLKNDKKQVREPSGFAKPSRVSDELCAFLGKPTGTEIARTSVTSFITEYIRNNNLQNPENKKEILLDTKLSKIINPGDETLTYFNLQRHMKHHYGSSSSASASASTSTSVAKTI